MADPMDRTARPARWWRVVLVVSLALNLAVAGLVGGALVSGKLGDGRPGRIDLGLGVLARALPADDRRAIGRDLRQDPALGGHDWRGDMAAITAALRADPYDPSVLHRLLDDQALRLSRVQARARAVMLDRIATMSPDVRRSFADRLDAEGRHARSGRNVASGG